MEIPVIIAPMERHHWKWIKDRASPVLCQDTTGLIALRGDKIVGAVAFDSWSYNSCLVHIAIEDVSVTRRLIRAACHFFFVYSGRGVLTGLTPADNKRALRLNEGVGMREVYRIKDGYKEGIDYVLQEMRREHCRWIKLEHREAA